MSPNLIASTTYCVTLFDSFNNTHEGYGDLSLLSLDLFFMGEGPMEVKLVVMKGKQAGKEISVPGPKFLIGRGSECQLRPQSNLVSRKHCAILVEHESVIIEDFGSTNHTFVNDEQVAAPRQIKTGDRIRVGMLELEVRLSVSMGGKKAGGPQHSRSGGPNHRLGACPAGRPGYQRLARRGRQDEPHPAEQRIAVFHL